MLSDLVGDGMMMEMGLINDQVSRGYRFNILMMCSEGKWQRQGKGRGDRRFKGARFVW